MSISTLLDESSALELATESLMSGTCQLEASRIAHAILHAQKIGYKLGQIAELESVALSAGIWLRAALQSRLRDLRAELEAMEAR